MNGEHQKENNQIKILGHFIAWGAWFVMPFVQNAKSTTSLPPAQENNKALVLAKGRELVVC